MTRIVITGLGGICGLGVDVASIWEALSNGRSAIGPITTAELREAKVRIGAEIKVIPDVGLDRRRLVTMDRFSLIAVIAAGEALRHANVVVTAENTGRIGAIVGTGIFGAETIEDNYHGLFVGGADSGPTCSRCRAPCRGRRPPRSAWCTACADRCSASPRPARPPTMPSPRPSTSCGSAAPTSCWRAAPMRR